MNYEFPKITHLNDVLPHIQDSDEFIVAEREWGSVVNYLVNKEDTFPETHDIKSSIRRECRGLKFDTKGFILARPYHKFFNINEREETKLENLDLNKNHCVLEKLDGSMVHPIKVNAHYDKNHTFRMCSKMGITDVALNAEIFISRNKNYNLFIENCISNFITPIFEWCSRKNRIVIDYPEDRLVLTAIRNNIDGSYYSYEFLRIISNDYNIDLVKKIDIDDIQNIVEHTKNLKDLEGYVIRFDDGHMLKIKADDYLRMHRAKDSLTHEKNVIYIFFNDMYDDFKSALHGNDRERMDSFYENVMNGFTDFCKNVHHILNELKSQYKDRKEFALTYNKNNDIKKLMFKLWNSENVSYEEIYNELKSHILKSCSTQTDIDKVRHMWNNYNWNYGVSNE